MPVPLHDQPGQVGAVERDPGARRLDLGLAREDQRVIGDPPDLGGEREDLPRLGLAGDRHARDQLVPRMGAGVEPEALRMIAGAGPGQDVAQHRRDQRADEEPRRDRLVLSVAVAVRVEDVQRVVVARDVREDQEVVHRDQPLQLGRVAHADLVEGPVLDMHICAPLPRAHAAGLGR
jgi:hypothetical protein